MAREKPSIPKGTRDFTPGEMIRRKYIFNTIETIYRLYGFLPIETPAMEKLSTLTGKYGEEGDKLLFKILNSGDFLKSVPDEKITKTNSKELAPYICGKGLRYDLTVPFARFVVQHQNEVHFPFKRYQIQPVWRADRPQKGRYREFYQCDADVIGSESMLNEAELLQIIHEVFKALKINVTIKINNRKILAGIADLMGTSDKLTDITVALDKLDKIGQEKVIQELAGRGIPASAIEKLMPVFAIQGDTGEKLSFLKQLLMNSEIGREGIQEISSVLEILKKSWASFSPELDITLARGLDYYTGAIIEVKANDVEIGSICGGGRYDNLTGVFGLPGTPGVGISFGADRIYDVLMQLGLFPDEDLHTTRAMFVNFGEKESQYCLPILKSLRDKNITAEIYPDAAKMKKQMAYADKKNIPFVVLAGENEIENGTLTLKNMRSGEQENIKPEDLPTKITS